MIEQQLIAIQIGVGEGTLGHHASPVPLDVIVIEARGIRPNDEGEEEVLLSLALGSDQARQLIDLLSPIAATMLTPYEQIAVNNNHHKESE